MLISARSRCASSTAALAWHLEEPDLSAILSADGRLLGIDAVNSAGVAIRIPFRLDGFPAGAPSSRLSVPHGDARGNASTLEFEPYSLTLAELEPRGL